MITNAKLSVEALESRNLLSADDMLPLPTCWVEFEQIGDWRRDVTLGVAETYELRATNTHPEQSVGVSASFANLFGGISTPEEASISLIEHATIPIDYDGELEPGEEVTFVWRAEPKIARFWTVDDPGFANGEVFAQFSGEGWNLGDHTEFSISGMIHVPTADTNQNGEVDFDDFLVVAANFGKEVDSYFAGDFDLNGTAEFKDFLILAAHFGERTGSNV